MAFPGWIASAIAPARSAPRPQQGTEAGQDLRDADSTWIAGPRAVPARARELVRRCRFTPRIMYTSDDPLVQQSIVAAGLGVTTMPGLSVSTSPDVESTGLDDFRRRVYVATYGEPPDLPATSAFTQAARELVRGPSSHFT